MTREEILAWLKEEREDRLESLWVRADEVRRERVGDAVHLRGLIEISNHCVRGCAYCGLSTHHRALERYRMTEEEILEAAQMAVRFGYGTVVLQSGEDPGLKPASISRVVRRIKAETPLAVTLGLGERSGRDLAAWRKAGADRYYLRFETSDPSLYGSLHPPVKRKASDRVSTLRTLKELGYETGSGVMLGLPGQNFASLVDDLELLRVLELDMIGTGPYLPHPDTPLGRAPEQTGPAPPYQVPNSELMAHKFMALTRITCPRVHIPTTTALASLNRETGYELGLSRGANVIMPNLTPVRYRKLYEIYPAKALAPDTPEEFQETLERRLAAIGRTVGKGPGGRRKP